MLQADRDLQDAIFKRDAGELGAFEREQNDLKGEAVNAAVRKHTSTKEAMAAMAKADPAEDETKELSVDAVKEALCLKR